jgi:hypothetical protein
MHMTTAGDSLSPSGYLSGQAPFSFSSYCFTNATGFTHRALLGECYLIFFIIANLHGCGT